MIKELFKIKLEFSIFALLTSLKIINKYYDFDCEKIINDMEKNMELKKELIEHLSKLIVEEIQREGLLFSPSESEN